VETVNVSADRQIARAAVVVMAAFAVAKLAGVAQQILVTRAFGTSATLDAFYAANRLPEILFNLMAGGALASAFVPTFVGFLTRGEREAAWRLASAVGNLLVVGLGTVATLAALAAPWIVQHIVAPFFPPDQAALTAGLLRILLLGSVVFGLSGLLMGILNAHQHFLLPALAPALYPFGLILGVLLFVPRSGIHGLAWGAVLGAALHLGVQLPGLRGRRASYFPSLGLSSPAVRQVAALMGPRVVGVAVVQLNFLVNTILASGQPEGSLTAITLAFTLMMMPQGLIAQAAGIAALPTFSAQVARGAMGEMRGSLARTLRGVLFLSLPASVGLIVLRTSLVSLLYQRGAFSASSTDQVAWALLWYAAGLVGHSLLEIIARAFYALHDTRTPVAVGAAAMSLNVVLSLGFSRLFAEIGWGPHGGLALANSLATAIECLTLLILVRRRLGGVGWGEAGRGVLATLGASAATAAALWAWVTAGSGWSVYLVGLGGVLAGGLVFWMAARLLGAPEAREMPWLLFPRRQGSPL
jgi:putative peptidoglycan lipid II flippase